MALSILNNIPSLAAQNQLSITGASLQKTLFRLSSGSRINSGADDAAGLAIADGLHANVTALTQSARNATDGIGKLQVADGALGQVTDLLNRAVTLATEASTGTVSDDQRGALNAEFTAIKSEIDRIGSQTTFNGQAIFGNTNDQRTASFTTTADLAAGDSLANGTDTITVKDASGNTLVTYDPAAGDKVSNAISAISAAGTGLTASIVNGKLQVASNDGSNITVTGAGKFAGALNTTYQMDVYLGDGTTVGGGSISASLSVLSKSSIGSNKVDLSGNDLTTAGTAQAALTKINDAIASVAADRGTLGASMNRLQSASNVINNQTQNLSAAEDGIRAADIAQEVANMTKFNILNQTGISALSQANQMQQAVLSLLR